MRFLVLGSVEARAGSGESVPVPPKPRALLAVLLLNTGRRVAQGRLESALWPERPPPSAPRVIRTYASALRQSLHLSRRDQLPRLAALGNGYRLEVAPGDLDLLVFDDLAKRGRQALRDGDEASAVRLLDQALGLWRGDPAEDVTVDDETDAVLAGLAERRLLAEEDRVAAELVLGHESALIGRLRLLVATHPLRERPWGQLMTALYLAGQQAAALAAYQQLRAQLVAQLGVDPNPQLQELHQQILSGAPLSAARSGLVVAVVPPVPRQLPSDVRHFTGRTAELERLDALLGGAAPDLPPEIVLTAVNGTAGVGKTALAVHWAHRIAGRFPDGQLYASLRGYGPAAPADALEVVARFLRALGTPPERVPADLDEAAAVYRSLLNGKRILIVLDNAASSEQVRPFLPGTPSCAVIVTSRRSLVGLGARDGAATVTLAPLLPAEAAELLGKILGLDRTRARSSALVAIARQCAFLPLALRIAAERATVRPHQDLAALAAQMEAARNRLDLLIADDDPSTSMRAVLSWSYQDLTADTARMFRLLGLYPGADISVPAAAALTGCDVRGAGRLLDLLAGAYMIEVLAEGRYRFHDLLRTYATERAHAEETATGRIAAIRRVLAWYLGMADAADRLLAPARRHVLLDSLPPAAGSPLLADYDQALGWFDAEHPNLVAALRTAASLGETQFTWKLVVAMASFLHLGNHWAEWIEFGRPALTAAQRDGNALGEAWVLNGLAVAHRRLSQPSDALDCLQRSLRIRKDAGDVRGEGSTLNNIGIVYSDLGRVDDAVRCFRQALGAATGIGDLHGETIALDNLADSHLRLRCPDRTVEYARQALTISRQIGHPTLEANALEHLGDACLALGQPTDAQEFNLQALVVWQRAGDRRAQATAHRRIGDLHRDSGNLGQARDHWRQALVIYEELGDTRGNEIRGRLCSQPG